MSFANSAVPCRHRNAAQPNNTTRPTLLTAKRAEISAKRTYAAEKQRHTKKANGKADAKKRFRRGKAAESDKKNRKKENGCVSRSFPKSFAETQSFVYRRTAALPFFGKINAFLLPVSSAVGNVSFAVFAGGRDKKCFFAYRTHPSRRRLNQTNICKFRTVPLRQAAVYSPLSFSFFATFFRYCFGARPIWRLKTFIKWLGDEKPMSIAISVMLLLVVSRSL